MGKKSQQTQAASSDPPAELKESYRIARVETINGNNIYTVIFPASTAPTPSDPTSELSTNPQTDHLTVSAMVELPPKFRNTMWIRRHGFVMVDVDAFAERVNKLSGEIVCVIHDEKKWRKMAYWPVQFQASKIAEQSGGGDDAATAESDDEDGSLDGNFNRRRRDSSDDSG